MKIDKLLHEDYAILTLKGEFDTFYCPLLQTEVEDLVERGISHLILDLKQVKFINSTALGAIIKVHKRCKAEMGELAISQPSTFVRDVIRKVGIDKLIPMYETEPEAIKAINKSLNQRELSGDAPVDSEKVMIGFPDDTRRQMIGTKIKTLLGKMANVDDHRIQFTWNGSKHGLTPDQTRQLFFKDGELLLRFQVRMIKRSFFEVHARVTAAENTNDGGIKVTAAISQVSDADKAALGQFAEDMAYLKRQLPGK